MKSKLDKVLVAREAEVEQASQALRTIEDVLSGRSQKVRELREKVETLEQEIVRFDQGVRGEALRSGDVETVASATRFLARLKKEKKAMQTALAEGIKDLERASERDKVAREDLLSARVEHRKVEHLVGSATRQSRIVEAAREEQSLEDLVSRGDKRGWPKR